MLRRGDDSALLACRRMRRFATWCTGHRKTVIIGWIVALIGIGMLAGSVGSDFTEEFKLPSSDSQEAFELLEDKFPQQSGVTAEIVYKAPAGADSASVKKKMEGVFAEAEKLPHVSEVASPYTAGGAAAISKDGEIAYVTVQYDTTTDKLEKDDIKKLVAIGRAASDDGLKVVVGGAPIEEVRSE